MYLHKDFQEIYFLMVVEFFHNSFLFLFILDTFWSILQHSDFCCLLTIKFFIGGCSA